MRIIRIFFLPCCRHVPTHARRCQYTLQSRDTQHVLRNTNTTPGKKSLFIYTYENATNEEIFRRRRKGQSCRSGKREKHTCYRGTGSFGNAFITALVTMFEPNKVIVYSRDELKQSLMLKKVSTLEISSAALFAWRRARRFPLETSLPWRSSSSTRLH